MTHYLLFKYKPLRNPLLISFLEMNLISHCCTDINVTMTSPFGGLLLFPFTYLNSFMIML